MELYKIIDAIQKEGQTLFPNLLLKYRHELSLSDADLGRLLVEYYEELHGGPESIALRRMQEKALYLWKSDHDDGTPAVIDQLNDAFKEVIDLTQRMLGRPLSSKDIEMLSVWWYDYHFEQDLIQFLLETCIEKKKFHMNYIHKVAESWQKEGLTTKDAAVQYLNDVKEFQNGAMEVGRYLGFRKVLSMPEKNLYQKWRHQYGFSQEIILKACDQVINTDKPSFRYIDSILTSWREKQLFTLEQVDLFLQKKRPDKKKKEKSDTSSGGRQYTEDFYEDLLQESIELLKRK